MSVSYPLRWPIERAKKGGEMFDVIVVGAGPAGSAAAKRCAESGLKTLMLEKESLLREKVCDGGLFSDGAQSSSNRNLAIYLEVS